MNLIYKAKWIIVVLSAIVWVMTYIWGWNYTVKALTIGFE